MSLARELEALLFVADAPTAPKTLANVLEATEAEVEQAVRDLNERLESSALQVIRIAGGLQLATRPELADRIGRFLRPQRSRLSRSLMETLAIVAYRQPVTLSEVDAVRGVQSEYSIKALQERRLIQEVGRKQAPGRPLLYGTTQQFLHQFNLNSIGELPQIEHALAPPKPAEGESLGVV